MRPLNTLKQSDRERARLETHAIIMTTYTEQGLDTDTASSLATKNLDTVHIEDIILIANARRHEITVMYVEKNHQKYNAVCRCKECRGVRLVSGQVVRAAE